MIRPNQITTTLMKLEPLRRQSLVTLFTTVSLTLIGFISTMYFAQTVGESVLGVYFLFLAYYNILNIILDGGLGWAGVKRISEGKERNEYFSALIILRFLLVGILLLFLFILSPLIEEINESGIFYWLVIALIIAIIWRSVSNGNYGSGKVAINQTCTMIDNFAKVAFQLIAIYLGFEASGLIGGFIFGMIIAALIGLHFLDLQLTKFNMFHVKSLFTFSLWIFLTSGGSLVFNYADTILIGHFMENADVGIYRVAFQFTTAATFTTTAMKTVLYPKVSNWSANGQLNRAENAFSKGLKYSLLLAIPVFVGGLLIGDKMLYFFYGPSFAKGAQSLYVLLAVQVVNVFMFLQTTYLSALNFPKESFKITAISAIANILLDIALIPKLGILGAAIATLFTMSLNSLLAYLVLRKIINVRLELYSMKSIAISTLGMGLFVGTYRMIMPLSNIWIILAVVILGGITYAILMLKFDAEIQNEIKKIGTNFGIT